MKQEENPFINTNLFFQGHFAFTLQFAALILGTGVFLGAVGAHWLSRFTPINLLETFRTGVQYQLIHGMGIFFIGILELIAHLLPENQKHLIPLKKLKRSRHLMLAGIFLFSFNCYMYAISGSKLFVTLIPFGGISFICAWLYMFVIFLKVWNQERLRQLSG